jgi:hypothetical protein
MSDFGEKCRKEQYDRDYYMCIEMAEDDKGDVVRLLSKEGEPPGTEFHFRHCFWTHQPFAEHPKFADQVTVYEALGKPLLTNLYKGIDFERLRIDFETAC